MPIKQWTERIPGDPNHCTRHAEVQGVTFCAFPYQSFYARTGWHRAGVSAETWQGQYNAQVSACYLGGDSQDIAQARFTAQAEAFAWAAATLLAAEQAQPIQQARPPIHNQEAPHANTQ